jgi:hypothetical protein
MCFIDIPLFNSEQRRKSPRGWHSERLWLTDSLDFRYRLPFGIHLLRQNRSRGFTSVRFSLSEWAVPNPLTHGIDSIWQKQIRNQALTFHNEHLSFTKSSGSLFQVINHSTTTYRAISHNMESNNSVMIAHRLCRTIFLRIFSVRLNNG